jgi:hypothetical protein
MAYKWCSKGRTNIHKSGLISIMGGPSGSVSVRRQRGKAQATTSECTCQRELRDGLGINPFGKSTSQTTDFVIHRLDNWLQSSRTYKARVVIKSVYATPGGKRPSCVGRMRWSPSLNESGNSVDEGQGLCSTFPDGLQAEGKRAEDGLHFGP